MRGYEKNTIAGTSESPEAYSIGFQEVGGCNPSKIRRAAGDSRVISSYGEKIRLDYYINTVPLASDALSNGQGRLGN